ncbi:MAG TPA: YciI family protein [Chitinophagaceae bacterium]|nr:YciI family protein [Chitinophagaceae bacterium]
MKKIIIVALIGVLSIESSSQTNNPKYDKTLADSLGGDDLGMKSYVLVILKTGTNKIDRKETVDSLFRGHMANIGRLAAEGKLIVAGPLKKNEKSYRGIFIFNVKTIEEAEALLKTDPVIKEKILDAELFQWYGSAALPEYLKSHEKIEKKKM